MKKFLLYAVAAMMAFTSCTDSEEVDIKYGVKVTVDPSTVLGQFSGLLISDGVYGLDMLSDEEGDAKLRITSLIYNESGELVDEVEGLVKDYSSQLEYTLDWLEDGKQYTVVTISSSIFEPKDLESYTINNKNLLSKLSVEQTENNFKPGFSYSSNWSVLGLAINTIDSKSYNNRISLKPATAMAFVVFDSFHSKLNEGVDTYSFQFGNNTIVTSFSKSSWFYSQSLANGQVNYYGFDVTEFENDEYSIVRVFNFLPTDDMYYNVMEFKGLEYSYWGASSIDIEAGKEYMFILDCENSIITTEILTNGRSQDDTLNGMKRTSKTVVNESLLSTQNAERNSGSARVLDLLNAIQK